MISRMRMCFFYLKARQKFLSCFATWLGLGMVASAAVGYLPAVGPVPLRFFLPPKPATNFMLPAITPEPVAVSKSTATNQPLAQVAVPTPNPPTVPVTPQSLPLIYQASSNIPETQQSDDVISPQMFLKYFNKSTNGSSATAIIPINPPNGPGPMTPNGFTPPAQPSTSSSKATYTIGK